MPMPKTRFIDRFLTWQLKHISQRNFVLLLSLVTGAISGLAAVVLKTTVYYTNYLLTYGFKAEGENWLYLAYPIIGIFLTIIFVTYFVKDNIGHGISKVLYSISRNNGILKRHNSYSSMIGSTITVGFGGSVGLEAPIVLTGASIGSNMGRAFRLSYRDIILLIGCGSAGAIAGIFKAPIAGIVFALEVLMLDLTMASLLPLLISAVTGAVIANSLMGKEVLFSFTVTNPFSLGNIPFYMILGAFAGFVSLYFTRADFFIEGKFSKITKSWQKLLIGGISLSILIFFLPPLYGEGYEGLKAILNGNGDNLLNSSFFYQFKDNALVFIGFLLLVILIKVVAMAITTGSGGVGGIFAPCLFVGGVTGFFFTRLIGYFTTIHLPEKNFALAGMAGIMSGVMHAPLTAIFLIAEITGGYQFIIPLMITSTISYLTINYFEPHSIYTKRLAQDGQLITHHKDKALLSLMKIDPLIEKDFNTIGPDATLGDLVKVVSQSKRNVFPVVDENNNFKGVVFINDVRNIIFKPEMYDDTYVRNLMFMPDTLVEVNETMEDVAQKFHNTVHYNLPVLADGKYIGFLSRANVFSAYRKMLKEFSEE